VYSELLKNNFKENNNKSSHAKAWEFLYFSNLMRIVSYNVNGIRAAIRKGLLDWMAEDDGDIYCFQELKANEEDIPTEEFEQLGYHCEWFSAQKKGYSGVGIISRQEPKKLTKGMNLEQADFEGRTIQAETNDFKLINTYFPSGSSGDERQAYKMDFLGDYIDFAKAQKKKHKNLIIVGDYNICHRPIDIHDPVRNKKSSGFLPEEREWMDDFFNAGFHDTFRLKNPHPHQYSWWSYRANARANNKGWRIDYISVTADLQGRIEDAGILADAMHSDHCPIFIELN
jgi:exodeoxyribonuclease-3